MDITIRKRSTCRTTPEDWMRLERKGKRQRKGKGGAKGPCWTCGQLGHQQWECPKGKGKGGKEPKGTGRGPQFGSCWICGGNHYQSECPKGKGKETKGLGKGKSTYEVA